MLDKVGLEIGGPSGNFRDSGILPLYRYTSRVDNCVYSSETIWEGNQSEGPTFAYHPMKNNGLNFIREATDLHGLPDNSYDFILSSHSLEHTANPVGALKEWMRVANPGGSFIIILPHYRHTFDHRRKPTPVSHMVADYEQRTEETDQTHVQEVLELHDLFRDPQAGTPEQFRSRSLNNFKNRCIHHHVFDEVNSRELLQTVGLEVEITEFVRPYHIVFLAHF